MREEYEDLQRRQEKESEALKVYEQKAQEETKDIRESFEANKDKVTEMLMARIMDVKLELPRVVVGNFEQDLK